MLRITNVRDLIRFALLVLAIGVQLGERAGAVNCGLQYIMCGAETIDYTISTHGLGFPGAYKTSGGGTTRFGLTCHQANYVLCEVYVAEFEGSDWYYRWYDFTANGARHVIMHGSGNLQVYNSSWTTVKWESDTDIGEDNAYLNIHDNGCVSLWHEDESGTFWSTC